MNRIHVSEKYSGDGKRLAVIWYDTINKIYTTIYYDNDEFINEVNSSAKLEIVEHLAEEFVMGRNNPKLLLE